MNLKIAFILFLTAISLSSVTIYAQFDTNDKLVLTDTDPKHSPMLRMAYGFGIGSSPHFYINVINHFDLYFNLLSKTSFNLKYDNLMKFWDTEFKDKYVDSRSMLPVLSYRNIDFAWNITLFSKNKKEDIELFSHMTSTGVHSVDLNYYLVPAESRRYLDLTIGYIGYRDVLSKEKYAFVTKDGYSMNDTHLNIRNKTFQLGLTYNKDEYVRGTLIGDRNLQQIKSRSIYLLLLYGVNTMIDPILYSDNNTIHDVDINKSNLQLQQFGFKSGMAVNKTIIGSYIGLCMGGEVALFPGIKGFNDGLLNISARFYLQVSLNLIKKNGDNYEF